MFGNKPILVRDLKSIQLLSVLKECLVIGQFGFSLFFNGQFFSVFIGHHRVVNLPEQTETGLITGLDQTAGHAQLL